MDELGLFIPTMTTISMCESNEEEEEKEYARTVEIIDRIYTKEDKSELARGEVTPLKRSRQALETQSARQKAAGGHSDRQGGGIKARIEHELRELRLITQQNKKRQFDF